MKKYFSLFTAVLLAASLSVLSFAKSDDDDGEPIPLEVNDPGGGGDPIIRGIVPISASYIGDVQKVSVLFLDDLGEVSICLTNETTGSFTSLMFDSLFGGLLIPLPGTAGTYSIVFYTESGAVYSGSFIVL